MDKRYIDDLENTIKKILSPLKDLPFSVIIKSICGFSVLPLEKNKTIIGFFEKAFNNAFKEINKSGIKSSRPNEVGNYIEPFIKDALNGAGFKADTPTDKNGRKRAVGYPDIELFFNKQNFYLEVKTYNIKNMNTTQRAFYFSPSENFKIIRDAPHLLVSYQMEKSSDGLYYAKNWKLFSLENLRVDLKHEFNQSNRNMYGNKKSLRLILEKK